MHRFVKRALLSAALLLCALPVVALATVTAGTPQVISSPAREVTNTTATFSGSVNPQGTATIYAFQYGTSTEYTQQTPAQYAGTGGTPEPVTATVAGLRPGTIYHVRLIAASSVGSGIGADTTFKTGGTAPPAGTPIAVTTAAAAIVTPHDAVLNGTINPSGSVVHYYFEFGSAQPYDLQTRVQTLSTGAPVAVSAPVSGLQSARTYHYRLVAVNQAGEVSAGADQTLLTPLLHRLVPVALHVKATPRVRHKLPDVVTVTGTLEPPDIEVNLACKGFVDVVFRAHSIAIQAVRAELRPDCTFTLPVRFSVRSRLLGGQLQVHVLFPGNQFLTRIEAPVRTIQVG